ncbi:hypothetical protein [Caulifigura coniformis]|nr:hypothetical protein [Caulifigura coniformis]
MVKDHPARRFKTRPGQSSAGEIGMGEWVVIAFLIIIGIFPLAALATSAVVIAGFLIATR